MTSEEEIEVENVEWSTWHNQSR